jgi:hypothetical protein
MALRTVQLAGEGKLIYTAKAGPDGNPLPPPEGVYVFTNDSCHPTDPGHQMYCEVITNALNQIEPASKPGPHTLKPPMVADNWEAAKLVPLTPSMLSARWAKLPETDNIWKAFHNRLPEIWKADKPGEKLSFKFKGTTAKIYDIVGPDGAQVFVTVDGQRAPKPVPRFDSYGAYHRLQSLTLCQDLDDAVHTVTIEIDAQQPDRTSVVKAGREKPGFDPKKYDGTVLRIGYIMLIGDIVE